MNGDWLKVRCAHGINYDRVKKLINDIDMQIWNEMNIDIEEMRHSIFSKKKVKFTGEIKKDLWR